MIPVRLIANDTPSRKVVLIVDKDGLIGEALARRLQHDFIVVLLSEELSDPTLLRNIVYLPYTTRVPKIPDNRFSHIFSILDMDMGESLRDILSPLTKKALSLQAEFICCASIYTSYEKTFRFIEKLTPLAKRILFGEPFATEHMLSDLPFNHMLFQARTEGRIVIRANGLQRLYPVFREDIISGIIQATFLERRSPPSSSYPFLLFPKHPPTQLSLSRMIAAVSPEIKVDFEKKKRKQKTPVFLPEKGVYLLREPYDISPYVRLFQGEAMPTKPPRIRKLPKKQKSTVFLKTAVIILTLIILFFLPLATLAGLTAFGGIFLSTAVKAAEKGDFSAARNLAVMGNTTFSYASELSNRFAEPARRASSQDVLEYFDNQIHVGSEVSNATISVIDALIQYKRVFAKKSVTASEDIVSATHTLKTALLRLKRLQGEKVLPPLYEQKLTQLTPVIDLFLTTSDMLPKLLGFSGRKRYLVLFQNNMELRPGGGFIGSYGLLEVERGTITDFTIHDVYDADGKLTGHIDPPFPLSRYLGVKHWYLRDSNFAIDFRDNAARAAYFLDLETGEKVDGVIGIDTAFLQALLEVLGPMHIPDYNEIISAENVIMKTQKHAEEGFFPGSTQKKDFLSEVVTVLKVSLLEKKDIAYMRLLQMVVDLTKRKHMLFVFSEPSIQSVFTVNGLSGTLWDRRQKEKKGVVNDFLGVIDANVGATKANFFVKRKLTQEIVIGIDGLIEETLAITYENTSAKGTQFGGEYRNYLRLVLPPETPLQSVAINGKAEKIVNAITDPSVYQLRSFLPPRGVEVEKTTEGGKSVYGFFVSVSPREKKTVTVRYRLTKKLSEETSLQSLNHMVFQQPGTEDSYTLTIRYPESLRLLHYPEKGSRSTKHTFRYTTRLSSDLYLPFQFAQQ